MPKQQQKIELVDVPSDRLLVKDGMKHYRRKYSLVEMRWGVFCGALLFGIVGWVSWRGTQVDAALFAADVDLLEPAGGGSAAPAGRGALPPGLTVGGWTEEKLGAFDPDNLYVKINGRADFFLSFGFEKLHSVLLVSPDGESSIDIEMYDQGRGANALGVYAGERSGNVKTNVGTDGVSHIDRNALYLTRGRYYVRLIGSDETPEIQAQLETLRAVFEENVEGEPLPWGHALFIGQLNLDPGKVSYLLESAFSFGFAKDVYAADIGDGDEDSTEIFIVAKDSADQAKAMAQQFTKGFLDYGEKAGKVEGTETHWIKDRYIDSLAAATTSDRFVVGVRGAPSQEKAAASLQQIIQAAVEMPDDLKDRAQPAAESVAAPADTEHGGDDGEGEGGYGDDEEGDPSSAYDEEGGYDEE